MRHRLESREAELSELRRRFPALFLDGALDPAALLALLDQKAEGEGCSLQWPGKEAALASAQAPPTSTLRRCSESSLGSDSQHLFIEGDSLEALKLLQGEHRGQVQLILIDPPYNTGKTFTYSDRQQRERGAASEGSSCARSSWLQLMAPRLVLARELLAADGLLVVHIDEHEEHSLRFLLDELMGEGNFLGTCIWDKRNPKGDASGVAYQHESILIYARDRERRSQGPGLRRPKANALRMLEAARRILATSPDLQAANEAYRAWVRAQPGLSGGEAMYNRLSPEGRVYRLVSMAWPNKKRAPADYFLPLIHPKTGEPCPVPERGWRNPPQTMERLLAAGRIEFGVDHRSQPQRIYYLDENMTEALPSVLPFGGSDDALLAKLGIPFEHPKPVAFIAELIACFLPEGGTVLDFFAGSGTTGHATWLANQRDGKERRFILVQLPEPSQTPGFAHIAAITQARLRAASELLRSEAGQGPPLDFGFQSFRLEPKES